MFFVLSKSLLKSVSILPHALVSLWLRGQQVPSDLAPKVKVPKL